MVRTYSRDFLLSLQHKNYAVEMEIPSSLCLHKRRNSRIKKRGWRGGIRNRLRRHVRYHPLPVITLSNVRSLNNKMEEVAFRVKREDEFWSSNLICFTETWSNENHNVDIEGFTTIRADRDKVKS